MARIRSVKPEFWSDEKMAELPREVRLTFLGLISALADDEGRAKGNPRVVRGGVYPLDDDISAGDVEHHLAMLEDAGVIQRYTVNGEQYIQIINWKRHQKIDRPTASRLPPPPDSPAPRRTLDESSTSEQRALPTERSGADGNGREMERSGADGRASEESVIPPDPDPLDREAIPAPRVALLPWAQRFLDTFYDPHVNSTVNRRMEAARQLYDTIDPNVPKGARLAKGEFVRARSPDHLEQCCRELVEDAQSIRQPSKAIVVLLKKLQDPPKGPSPTEVAADRERERTQLEERYQREAKAAGVAWAKEHPDEWAKVRAPIDREFGDGGGFIGRMAREAALIQAGARAAGFPSFDQWAAERSGRSAA